MEKLGARGQYGFFEAIDFTAGRMPQGESCKVIRSFMAHHQGMSLLTLANMLLPSKMYDYFHRDKRVQAAELLLIERIPSTGCGSGSGTARQDSSRASETGTDCPAAGICDRRYAGAGSECAFEWVVHDGGNQ